MPTFQTPQPIQATIEAGVGDVRVIAGDRADTVVEVRPTNPANGSDVKAAKETRVEYAEGRLLIKAARPWRHYTPFGSGGSVEVTVDLPTGSSVTGDSMMGAFHAEGELGECRYKTAMGHVRVDHAEDLRLKTAHGTVAVDRAVGQADITGSGEIRIERIDGQAVVKNSNGDTRIGTVTGDLRIKSANGDITVGRADGSVAARTACGDIRIGEVLRSVIDLKTAAGEIEVGVREGTAAWLDVSSQYGQVRNALDTTDGPSPSEETVEVRARTGHGDIAIRRAGGTTAGQT